MYDVFAESIFTATRMSPYDPTGMNPYGGIPVTKREKKLPRKMWSFLRTTKKSKD